MFFSGIDNINYVHGESYSKLHNCWRQMKVRCLNSNDANYKNYGGRGITVCPEWANDYTKFRDWALNNGYQSGLFQDRIDNDKGYNPENCRFTTKAENARNRRTTKLTKSKVEEIRFKYKVGKYTHRELGIEYNIDQTNITRIINQETWRNI